MQIIEDRRALHQIPELDRILPETIGYLKNALVPLGCQIFPVGDGSLGAFFDFGRESAIAFRADMDALPISEKSRADYTSRHEGIMHACGHDGHMAILLELARRLSRRRDWRHNVLLVFQCAEETTGGAKNICDSGIFDKYHIEAIFGAHLWPGLPAGEVFSRREELMAQSCEVTVDIYGKSAHIAKATEGIDALMAGAAFYRKAMAMEAALPAHIFRLLKFGKFHSGTVRNALSAHTHMEGSLRAFQRTVFNGLAQGLRDIAAQVEQEFACTVRLHLSQGYPAVINPGPLYDRVRQLVPFQELDIPCMTAEDFSYYQQAVPGMFFFLGLGDCPALHADNFDFDDSLLTKGADFFQKIAEEFV